MCGTPPDDAPPRTGGSLLAAALLALEDGGLDDYRQVLADGLGMLRS